MNKVELTDFEREYSYLRYGGSATEFMLDNPKAVQMIKEEARVVLELAEKEVKRLDSLKEPVSEDLGEYINELSKQFPEVSFAKLSRIAVSVSRWQQNQDVKNKHPKVTNRTELDEYAYQCAYDMSNDWVIENPTWHDVEDACKLGANWQKEQIMKGAIELPLYLDGEFLTVDYDFTESGFKVGDKVKLIIIKED